MVPIEQKKLVTLQEKSDTLGKEMEEAQSKATEAMRAEDKAGRVGKYSAPVQRLINNGFQGSGFFTQVQRCDASKVSLKSKPLFLQGTRQRPHKHILRQILLINPKLCIKDRLGNLFTRYSILAV